MEKTISFTTSDLYSVAEAAVELGIQRPTVYRWVERQKLIGVRFGGILYIPKSEVERVKLNTDAQQGPKRD